VTVLVFAILLVGILFMLISMRIVGSTFNKTLGSTKASLSEENKKNNKKLLEDYPEISAIIEEIIQLENYPKNEACKTRAAILRAKLKISIRNPVIRVALTNAVKSQKK